MIRTGQVIQTPKAHLWGVVGVNDGALLDTYFTRDEAREESRFWRGEGKHTRIVKAVNLADTWEVTK